MNSTESTTPAPMHLLEALNQVVRVAERRKLELRDMRAACETVAQALRDELREGDTVTVDGVVYLAATLREHGPRTPSLDTLALARSSGVQVTLDARPIKATLGSPPATLMPAANDPERLRFLKHADRVFGAFRALIDEHARDLRAATDAATKLNLR